MLSLAWGGHCHYKGPIYRCAYDGPLIPLEDHTCTQAAPTRLYSPVVATTARPGTASPPHCSFEGVHISEPDVQPATSPGHPGQIHGGAFGSFPR